MWWMTWRALFTQPYLAVFDCCRLPSDHHLGLAAAAAADAAPTAAAPAAIFAHGRAALAHRVRPAVRSPTPAAVATGCPQLLLGGGRQAQIPEMTRQLPAAEVGRIADPGPL